MHHAGESGVLLPSRLLAMLLQAQASGSEDAFGKDDTSAPLLAADAKLEAQPAAFQAEDVEDKLEERSTFNPRKMRPKRYAATGHTIFCKSRTILSVTSRTDTRQP